MFSHFDPKCVTLCPYLIGTTTQFNMCGEIWYCVDFPVRIQCSSTMTLGFVLTISFINFTNLI